MKIYMAGVGAAPDILYARNAFRGQRIFISYYDMTEKALRVIFKHGPKEIVCDSGAHAYFARTETSSATPHLKAKGELPPISGYLDNYLTFCKRFKNQINTFVELDTQEIHGAEFQKIQREKIEAVVGRDKFMPVWHANEDEAAFRHLIENYSFIGIEGIGTKRISTENYLRLTKLAYEKNVRIHAFASVRKSFLGAVPVFSSDSSAWSSFYRYGKFIKYEDGNLRFYDKKDGGAHHIRSNAKGAVRVICNKDYFLREDGQQVINGIIRSIQQFEEHLTKLWKEKGITWKDSQTLNSVN